MALKRLKVKLAQAPATAGDTPIVAVEGDQISRYNKADAEMKEAERLMKELRPDLLEIGTDEVFKISCAHPTEPSFTVKLEDDTGEMLRVQFTKRYGQIANVEATEALFEALTDREGRPVDINDFVQETVVGSFDNKVFLDAKGNFDRKVYDRFRKAIEGVAAELQVPCPLSTHKVVVPKEKFHTERFMLFGDVAIQRQLTTLMPNTTQIVPVTVNKTNGK
jgi:hypothetical protein